MRGAGCTWNDITDRGSSTPRWRARRSRPIPSGQVTVRQALAWAVIQCAAGVLILITFTWAAIALGICRWCLVAIYPLPSASPGGRRSFLASPSTGARCWPGRRMPAVLAGGPVLLYLSGIAWTLFYDTIYAHQDKEDDALIGVKSTARLFERDTARWLRLFAVLSVVLMAAAMGAALRDAALIAALVGVAGFAAHLGGQLHRLDIDDPENCMQLFRSNRDAGLIVVATLAVAALA
jgi:4-hydroxybenzoate polyprenyltransferase